MFGVTGIFMEISKELSFDAGQTESVCMDERASGKWVHSGESEEGASPVGRALGSTEPPYNAILPPCEK